MEDYEDRYPPFLVYESVTRTLIFDPVDVSYQGNTYYFVITVKEVNSDSMLYNYYSTV